MKKNRLLVTKNVRLKEKRTRTRPKPRARRPNQFCGIDMTKKLIGGYGWMYLVMVYEGDNRSLFWNAIKSKRLAKGIK